MDEGGNVVEMHTCDFFPERWFQLIVVLRSTNKNIFDRLEARYIIDRLIFIYFWVGSEGIPRLRSRKMLNLKSFRSAWMRLRKAMMLILLKNSKVIPFKIWRITQTY